MMSLDTFEVMQKIKATNDKNELEAIKGHIMLHWFDLPLTTLERLIDKINYKLNN